MHHPNGPRKWVIACILAAGVRNDEVIVMSVKMALTEKDKHVINIFRVKISSTVLDVY